MSSLQHLKVGDRIDRYHGGGFMIEMEVTEITDKLLICAAVSAQDGSLFYGEWAFDRETGMEEDDDLHWGVKYGKTGTYLKEKPNANNR